MQKLESSTKKISPILSRGKGHGYSLLAALQDLDLRKKISPRSFRSGKGHGYSLLANTIVKRGLIIVKKKQETKKGVLYE